MKQVTKNKPPKEKVSKKNSKKKPVKKDKRLPKTQKVAKASKKHPLFGTSKLEQDFAKNFLDKLGVRYVWQFEAKEIGRFFDYYIVDSRILIEIDGDFYHSYGLVREEMSPMQKKNKRVDECKDRWAALHSIPLIRIWEHDIRKNPKKVMELLKEKIRYHNVLLEKEKEKNKRHVNNLDSLLRDKKNKEEK